MHADHGQTDLLQGAIIIGDETLLTGSGGELDHVNPSTGKAQASFPLAGTSEVDHAVAVSKAAQKKWRALPPAARQAAIMKLADLIVARSREFSVINALEAGTPYRGYKALIENRIPAWFGYYAGWIEKILGDTLELAPGRPFNFTTHEPVGVVVKILTWNSPLGNIYMSVVAALSAGCSVIIKPPELAPFSAVLFGKLAREAGFPIGTVSVLPGGPEAGDALVRHIDVDKISFTGGVPTAKLIQASAAEGITPLVMELGGKSAHLVFEDADLDKVVGQELSFCRLAGQVCTAPARMIVHESLYEETVRRTVAAFNAVKVGDPFDDTVDMGPVISKGARDRILGMVDRAVSDGATVESGGNITEGELGEGYFLQPMLLTGAPNDSYIAQEEVFGPVATITSFKTDDEAIELANDSKFGLAGYIQTRDLDRALWAASKLEVGSVGINGGPAPASYNAPFGGVKQSGYGREGGREGIMEFLRVKNVNIVLS
ncbi:MAG: aldA 1 [Subtercola sp.]|nr:aldA 1 [Subtercola sp.]